MLLVLCALTAGAAARQSRRPSLIDYAPAASPGATVVASSGMARFTVLTDRLLRMEYARTAGVFEDHATLAVLNRALTVPRFSHAEEGGVLTVTTAAVRLSYAVGEPFAAASLRVEPVGAGSTFPGWRFGDAAPGNLLGTIRGLDDQGATPLNCTLNAAILDNGEFNHCEWGLVSRDGWAVYDDSLNFELDGEDWWVPGAAGAPNATASNACAADLYGFFHGLDFKAAIADYAAIGGRTIMVPRFASGVWWSHDFNDNNVDVRRTVEAYESRSLPLDTFVIDMQWHTKNDWGGFSFDRRLFPFPADTLAYLKARGLGVALNLHDATGVNEWEDAFGALARFLRLPNGTAAVPLNLVNATIAYAVEDIVLGSLLGMGVDFFWPDWQQGGAAGGLTGRKQNPTMWLNHLRCTDRHRVGDDTRAMVLARWGGLGGHRYQVGFSGDVGSQQPVSGALLSWGNLAYQPYFSATAANVLHPFWSHDIVGYADDMEMYTRWLQVGALSGTMRSHDRGQSGGACANAANFSCWVVKPWEASGVSPGAQGHASGAPYFEANRAALRLREWHLPYIYNTHRSAFDSGLGLMRPMYFDWPASPRAYAMNAAGDGVQYLWGPDIIAAPIVAPVGSGDPLTTLARKAVWLPDGAWYDVNSGVLLSPSGGNTTAAGGYTLGEVPLFYRGGAVIPYLPLDAFPSSIGVAMQQYTFLGLCVVPGAASGSVLVYEDDGATTAYLTANASVWTTASYVSAAGVTTVTVSSTGVGYPAFPRVRSYEVRLLSAAPLASATINGAPAPFCRFGAAAARGRAPGASCWYFETAPYGGTGVVIHAVGLPTAAPATIVAIAAVDAGAATSGLHGALLRAIASKDNLDKDWSTPGATTKSSSAGYLSVLASTADGLAYLAGANASAWLAAVQGVPALLALALEEVRGLQTPRANYSAALLESAAPSILP